MANKLLYSLLFFVLLILSFNTPAQTVEIMTQGKKTNLRGLSISKNAIWVCGSNGTVGTSINAGKTWQWHTVKGFDKTEFRDVEALSATSAVIMGIASPAYILKTTNGGTYWKVVYENSDTAMFLDAMSFNGNTGYVIGDPINQKIFIAKTTNYGDSWKETNDLKLPNALPNEAFFAASGTNILINNKDFFIVSGGHTSRLFSKGRQKKLAVLQGAKTTGANGMARLKNHLAIVGGDFMQPAQTDSVFIFSNNLGKTWQQPKVPPTGYRSGVCYVSQKILVTCGINGVDVSNDGGYHFTNISKEGFNVCAYDIISRSVFLAGSNGKIGKIQF